MRSTIKNVTINSLVKKISYCLVIGVLFGMVGCAKSPEKTVVIATKPSAEQFLLGNILKILVEEKTDINVVLKLNIGGGTSNIHPALLNGDIDIYPEYSGTGWLFVLKKEEIPSSNELFQQLKQEYDEKYNLVWLDRYGFNNTFTIAVTNEVFQEESVETYSDLAAVSSKYAFGAEYDFYEREDGFTSLKEVYGFNFGKTSEIDIGLKYEAISSNKVDVINAFSTDSLIKKHNLKVLIDDKSFFPPYEAGTVIRGETLATYPELEDVLNSIAGQISDEDMLSMNYQVEVEHKLEYDVAKQFLISKGIID